VPFLVVRKTRRRDRLRLFVLCDISDSVRLASRFMLELVSAVQSLFADARSFVFVSDLGETTELFRRGTSDSALAAIYAGTVVSPSRNSNYGRALEAFEDRHGREVNRRTTVVILGDGRTNYFPDRSDLVRTIRDRAAALYWICPEGPGSWGTGDSAMLRYAEASTEVLMARTARELEVAAREVVARRK
jgi:hypothetical protein